MLEPYSKQKDVGYVIVAPDNDYILTHVRLFFRELSTLYELCRLGRHVPVSQKLRDGVMRVGKKSASDVADQPVDEWFSLIGRCCSGGRFEFIPWHLNLGITINDTFLNVRYFVFRKYTSDGQVKTVCSDLQTCIR